MDKETAIIRLLARSDQLVDTATKVGVAVIGFKANNHWSGALTGLVALRLSNSPNLAAGVAGVGVLTGLGLLNIIQQIPKEPPVFTDPNNPHFVTTSQEKCLAMGGTIISTVPFGGPKSLCGCSLP